MKRNRNSFVRLNIQHQGVRRKVLPAKYQVRRPPELNGDFSDPAWKPLAGPNVKRNTGPPPVVDQNFCRDESFYRRILFYAGFLPVPRQQRRVPWHAPWTILPAHNVSLDTLLGERANRLQHFNF